MPSLSTASMLLRAEDRTVTAVLSARASKQVVEVIEGAMRRAGILANRAPQQASSDLPTHHSQPIDLNKALSSYILRLQVSNVSNLMHMSHQAVTLKNSPVQPPQQPTGLDDMDFIPTRAQDQRVKPSLATNECKWSRERAQLCLPLDMT